MLERDDSQLDRRRRDHVETDPLARWTDVVVPSDDPDLRSRAHRPELIETVFGDVARESPTVGTPYGDGATILLVHRLGHKSDVLTDSEVRTLGVRVIREADYGDVANTRIEPLFAVVLLAIVQAAALRILEPKPVGPLAGSARVAEVDAGVDDQTADDDKRELDRQVALAGRG
jgi:hypothetical protein